MHTRRDFLRLLGVGGAVFASGLAGCEQIVKKPEDDFWFVQLSDTHWGYKGPANPDAESTLPRAIEIVNSLPEPDFVVFTGDLTHTTDDANERRARLLQFQGHVSKLRVKQLWFLPGEHDAALDAGAAFQERFGPTHYSFDHKGIHFVALDNVSDPQGAVGDAQRDWLHRDLSALGPETPVVVLTHRPLFDLYPQWDWATKDGAKVVDVLLQRKYVTVFYGHIHQEHHHATGAIDHHAARSLVFPQPAPGSQPKRAPVPWNASSPDHGLGFRRIEGKGTVVTFREAPYSDPKVALR
jgi:3',5'-cyclic AMP phosphodiesterase CpdA